MISMKSMMLILQNDGYDTDSVIYLDDNGNIIKAPFN
jgi:hypothetical protein